MSSQPSDCRFHIAVTPYQPRLVPEGVIAVESFDPAILERCKWPKSSSGGRVAEGGCGGDIVPEHITVVWNGNKLVYPISFDAKPLAERLHASEINYLASFVAQLDGQVAYVPSTAFNPHQHQQSNGTALGGGAQSHHHSSSSYLILVESPIAVIQAIRFAPHQAAIIDPFVKHSMPIPLNEGAFEYTVWHRSVNAVVQLTADPAGIIPIIINQNKVDRSMPISVRRVVQHLQHSGGSSSSKHISKGVVSLSKHFAKELLPLEEVSVEEFAPFGRLILDFSAHIEQVSEVPWPGSENNDGTAGRLEQDFLVNWQYKDDEPAVLELEFEGLNGSFAGEKGRPGVEYNPELGVYRANLLMARPDGSFFIQPTDHNDVFAMVFALPNKENGNPVEESLRVFAFRNGTCLRLEPNVWHSVPIPLLAGPKQGILFREIIAATNANLVVNVRAESGHPMQFVQGA